jgi:hypothetical protein
VLRGEGEGGRDAFRLGVGGVLGEVLLAPHVGVGGALLPAVLERLERRLALRDGEERLGLAEEARAAQARGAFRGALLTGELAIAG